MRAVLRGLAAATFSIVAACSSHDDPHAAAWQRYIDGLQRVLEREAEALSVSRPRYPHPASVKLPINGDDINLLEFLRLRRCALSQTLAEQNSILGRHRDSATDLVFSLRFLDEVEPCIAYLKSEDDNDLANTLATVRDHKQQQLAHRLANALLGGGEYRQLWSSSPDQRQAYPDATQDQATRALQRWQHLQQQWLSGQGFDAHTDVVAILETLRAGLGGEMLHFQAQALAGLQQANALLQQRIDGRPLCLQGSPTPRAQRYAAVLHRQFIGSIQVLAAQSYRHQNALLTATRAIETTLAEHLGDTALPAAYRQWQTERDALLKAVTASHREHVSLSSQLLKQCGLSASD